MSPCVDARNPGVVRCVILAVAFIVMVCLSQALAGHDVSMDDDILLTPWWGMRLSVGEEAEVDCGVLTGGDADTVTIEWVDSGGKTVATNSSMRQSVRRHNKHDDDIDSVNDAFSVLTMTLSNMSSSDQGTYTCHATRTRGNVTETFSRNISIAVVSPHQQCGFEGEDVCGWTSDNTTRLQWQRLDGADTVDRATGPRFDHTYGPSKHVGHFMAVDLPGQAAGEKTTKTSSLVSPVYEKHDQSHCLQFWFAFHGSRQGDVGVEVRPTQTAAGNSSSAVVLWSADNATTGRVARLDIPPQSADYQIVFSTETCKDKCYNSVFAIDDIRIWLSKCADVQETSPDERLKVRLVNGSQPTEGRLEVLHDGMWGSVCSRQFGDEEAQVVCRMLGYSAENAEAKTNASFGAAPDNYVTWLQRLGCVGDELDIASCVTRGEEWGHTECGHDEDAAVICEESPAKSIHPLPATQPMPTTTKPKPKKTSTTPPQSTTTTKAGTTTTDTTTTATTITQTLVSTTPPPTNDSSATKHKEKPNNATSNETKLKSSTTSTRLLFPKATTPKTNDTEDAPHMIMYPNHSTRGRHTGLVVVVTLVALVGAAILGVFFCKRKKIIKQNAYITFSTPKYRREQLPNNDFNMESPLTLSSNGYTVLA